MRLALLHTRLRTEETLLLDALTSRGHDVEVIDLRAEVFDPARPTRWQGFDLVLDRCVSLTASLTATRILESMGVRCVNRADAIEVCSDKLRTTLALIRDGIPTPAVRIGIGAQAGLAAVESLGYPAVLKPTIGSWGRLLARVNDRDAAEAIVEHRETLGSAAQHVIYAQEHINKPGRDLRVFIVGGEAIAAIERASNHWVTNTARGARPAGFTITDEAARLSRAAVQAVGADIAAVDLLECPTRGLLVNEVNHSMEFRNSISTSGVDIPARIADHLATLALQVARVCNPCGLRQSGSDLAGARR
jgi:[lysine-biosynthesis-protein LysW]--L-2-aminoadipate ligase